MAAAMLGLSGVRVLAAEEDESGLRIVLEPETPAVNCAACGRQGVIAGVETEEQPGLPAFGRPSLLVWQLRRWRCVNPSCDAPEWTEQVPSGSARHDAPKQ